MSYTIRTKATETVPSRAVRYQSLRVRRSLEETSSEAQFVLVDSQFDLLGETIEVLDDGVVRLTGVVETFSGIQHRGFTATARSMTSTLSVFQSATNQLYRRNKGQGIPKHANIMELIGQQVGLTLAPVRPERDISRFRIKIGESLLSAAQRLAATGTWVLTDDAEGRIRMYDYTGAVATQSWIAGRPPLLEVESKDSSIVEWRDVIIVRGQRIALAGDADGNADDAQISDDFEATTFPNRPSQLVIPNKAAASKADAVKLALWEATKRGGQSIAVSVALTSWAAEPGDVVNIRDDRNALNVDLVVQKMETSLTPTSESYSARLVSPLVYDSRPRTASLPRVA